MDAYHGEIIENPRGIVHGNDNATAIYMKLKKRSKK